MSLTVQQLLADAKRLSGRLREHDASADNVISNAQEVLKAVDAMRQYQEDIDNLNCIAHNRPRTQLVLGKTLLETLIYENFPKIVGFYLFLQKRRIYLLKIYTHVRYMKYIYLLVIAKK